MSELRDAYRQYLQASPSKEAAHALARALRLAGLGSEAELMQLFTDHGSGRYRCDSGSLQGTTVHVGSMPPELALYGEHWLDTCDLSTMVLLPRYVDPESRGNLSEEAQARLHESRAWFALHPVRRYQYEGFLETAPLEPAAGAFERDRTTWGSELDAITGVTCSEAGAYLYWFGKHFPAEWHWRAAKESLGLEPWFIPAHEWVGASTHDEDAMVAISPSTLDIDPEETEGVTEPAHRMLYSPTEAPVDVTFRAAIHMTWGLTTANVVSQRDWYGRILGRIPRSRF